MARTILRKGDRPGAAFLLLAVLFAVIAAVLVFAALNQGDDDKEASAAADTRTVVVAAHDIAPRTQLDAEMLRLAEVPEDMVLSGAFDEIGPLEGQYARYPILEGEQVVASKVGVQDVKEEGAGVSFLLPPGLRAFSISVSEESSVGGLVLPGDLVDVIGILEESDVGVDKAVTLIQNVEVLAVAQEAQEPIPAAARTGTATPSAPPDMLGDRPKDVEPNPGARTVTLAVTQEQAQLLALVQARGELALTLRSFGDRNISNIPETNLIPYGTPTGTR
ncbi:MAG: Flp pilus assembly protein CpaB [Dehalococcoidia bacterium]|nr:Flp pilus assembly protein CpaB [Dehalococcoidia bacterium]